MADRTLLATALVFATALVVHGADHARRGVEVVTATVRIGGAVQFLAGVVAVALVLRRHRYAPSVAATVGLLSAVGFVAAHLLPQWSSFSDPFTGAHVAPGVNAFSWFAALFEIAADVAFGCAGLALLRRHQ
jgi:hypothetical protein